MSVRNSFCHSERSEGPRVDTWRVRSSFNAASCGREILCRPMAAQDDTVRSERQTEDYITRRFG
jgi:hypothetical protein